MTSSQYGQIGDLGLGWAKACQLLSRSDGAGAGGGKSKGVYEEPVLGSAGVVGQQPVEGVHLGTGGGVTRGQQATRGPRPYTGLHTHCLKQK